MLTVIWGLGWVVTSIERTAYPRFKRLITAHELHLFFSPSRDELQWAADATDCDEHLLALLLMLKSYRRMGCFPALEDVPEMVVDFVRRAVELPEGTLPVYRAERTAKHHRGLVRKQVGVTYDQAKARGIVEQSIRKEAAAKNRPADLINIALEKVVEAGLELPGFSTFDKMASKIRTEVNASICAGIHDRMSGAQRAGLLRLLEERDSDGTTLFNRLKKPAKGPTWSHFKNLTRRLDWLDELGDTDAWMDGVAAGKITDFAGEADAADASELRDVVPVKRIALVAALTHKARMRVRDDLATMFCKRVATKIKKAKAELEEIRLAEREIVEALIGNYRTVLKHIDEGGPAQEALTKAAAMTAETRQALEGLDEEASLDEVATRLEGKVSPAVIALVKAQLVQAGGFGTVTKAVEGFGGFAKQAVREGLRPPRQLLGSAAVRADRPGPGGDVRPGRQRQAEVHRDQRGQPGTGRPRARPAAPGGPRRVHHRLQRGGQGGRPLLYHAELAQGRGRQDPHRAVRPQALRGDGLHRVRRGTAYRRRRGGRLGGVRRLVRAAAGLGGRPGDAGVLPGGGRPCRGGRERRVRRDVLPPAAGGQAAGCRRSGRCRVPGERRAGHRPGDGHPVTEGVQS
ncbi:MULTISPECIES: DUF4158 domain-containing protein [Streptomyces]|uniref:DUF4158 domain-containing protein n=1 Tax=Streptomyces TaxID=1883 RepID=UPI00345BFF6C